MCDIPTEYVFCYWPWLGDSGLRAEGKVPPLGCGIGRSGRRCHAVDSVVLKSRFQLGDVHRSVWFRTSSCRQSGTPAGTGVACGVEAKNTGRLLRDSASAAVFLTPAICFAVMPMLCTAHRNAKIRSNLKSLGSRAEPLFTAYTTAILSQRHWTCLPLHKGPHNANATTMGTNSFGLIGVPRQAIGHDSWNHLPSRLPHNPKSPRHQKRW